MSTHFHVSGTGVTGPLARRASDNYKWWVLITAIFGAFVSILDATVVNTALPHIQLAFGTDLHTASYVVTGVLPLDMVENLISLCKPISGSFFHHGRAQTGHLLLEESSIRRLLLALSPISHDMLLQPHLA